ncbi:hypothetical protein [Lacrimispora saccharolytica]|uniref:hypothetical protein n=1 Tax=Lacrimispora saccharolytica TaxID=84030 RepID=UPI00265D5D52|nr:hypothetical protein [Lacrimispora saccharolytica]MCF2655991.1 hypothetical protein [Lacrimispora saccharolytica]
MREIVQRQKSGLRVSLPLSVNDVGGMLAALNARKFMEHPAYKWIKIWIFSPAVEGDISTEDLVVKLVLNWV